MRIIFLILAMSFLLLPVSAMEFSAPQAPDEALEYLNDDTQSFSEGLLYVLKTAINKLQPSIAEAATTCLSLVAAVILISILRSFSGNTKTVVELAGCVMISILLLQPSNSLIQLGSQTIAQLSQYGKLLLPVMTAAMAAQGGTVTSANLYVGTAVFDTLLTSAIANILVPLLYIYLCLCVADSAVGENVLKNIKAFVKWAMTWFLKIALYAFTGYLGITGVISGSADATAVKAAKLAMSGAIPVVGSIISDASEAVLVSAGVMKNSVGIYGLLAILGLCIGPFIKIGVQYLLLKVTAAFCGAFSTKQSAALIRDFSGAMGLLLAMTGSICVLFLISTVCFMRGIA